MITLTERAALRGGQSDALLVASLLIAQGATS